MMFVQTRSLFLLVLLVVLLSERSITAFHVLYPESPLNPKAADDPYHQEFLSVKEKGISCSLFDFDSLVGGYGAFRPRPAIPSGERVLYRGWMMTPTQYGKLVSNLEKKAEASSITSVADFTRCHHLPGWYESCADLTAETHFVDPEMDDILATATALGWDSYFVKDYVKSNTGNKGSIAKSPEQIMEIVYQLKFYRDEIEGGIALRKVEDYVENSEQRYFVVNQKAYGPTSADVPSIVHQVAERIKAPFYSVDIVQTAQGEWRVVELGDGQVSDRKTWPLDRFVDVLLEMA